MVVVLLLVKNLLFFNLINKYLYNCESYICARWNILFVSSLLFFFFISFTFLSLSLSSQNTGDIDGARNVLKKYRMEIMKGKKSKNPNVASAVTKMKYASWKIYLESLMIEKRDGNNNRAILQAKRALKIHSGTGRLWAMLIQLEHNHGPKAQFHILKKALNEVPKSGEVWCEAGECAVFLLFLFVVSLCCFSLLFLFVVSLGWRDRDQTIEIIDTCSLNFFFLFFLLSSQKQKQNSTFTYGSVVDLF